MAFSLEESSRHLPMNDYNSYNEDLKSSYYKYKDIFEEVTKLTPQEQSYVQKNHLEDKLASVNYDFWKNVNSIVTSYFDIVKLLQKKQEIESDISRIWFSKLSSAYNPQSQANQSTEPTSVWNNVGPSTSVERMRCPTIEDRVMRFKVASVYSADLIKTIHRSIFSAKNEQVLPGSSNLKRLEKEAKWFRNHKRELESEIKNLEEHKKVLREKITYTDPNENSAESNKGKSLWNMFKTIRSINYTS